MAISILIGFIKVCKGMVDDFLDKNCPQLAAAIAFYALFSVIPLVLVIIAGLDLSLKGNALGTHLADELGNLVPVSRDLVRDTFQGVIRSRTVTGVTGILVLLWSATAVFGVIRKGINAAWGVRRPRSFLKERLIDFCLMLGAGMLILISGFAGPIVDFFKEVASLVFPTTFARWDSVWVRLPSSISMVLTVIVFLVLYRFIPNTRVRFRDVWPGAVMAAVAFQMVNSGFVWYVGTFPQYNLAYGLVGAVVALLGWVYISAIILLFGALLSSRFAAYLASRSEEKQVRVLAGIRET